MLIYMFFCIFLPIKEKELIFVKPNCESIWKK